MEEKGPYPVDFDVVEIIRAHRDGQTPLSSLIDSTVPFERLEDLLDRLHRPVKPSEVDRRRRLGERVAARRQAMKPLDMPVEDLIREDREERGL